MVTTSGNNDVTSDGHKDSSASECKSKVPANNTLSSQNVCVDNQRALARYSRPDSLGMIHNSLYETTPDTGYVNHASIFPGDSGHIPKNYSEHGQGSKIKLCNKFHDSEAHYENVDVPENFQDGYATVPENNLYETAENTENTTPCDSFKPENTELIVYNDNYEGFSDNIANTQTQ